MKALINFDDSQSKKLDEYCHKNGYSRTEVVRRAIDFFFSQEARTTQKSRISALNKAFGLFKDNPINADKHLNEIREEWDESSI